MDPNALIRLALSLGPAVLEVLPLRGHWEVWFQIELARLLRRNGVTVQLEAGYGVNSLERMDLLMAVGGRQVTTELKVESATVPNTFAGRRLYEAAGSDLFKSRGFRATTGRVLHRDRWVLVVAHSGPAIAQLAELHSDAPPSYFGRVTGVAAAVYVSENY